MLLKVIKYIPIVFQYGNGFEKWPSHSVDSYIDPYRIGYKNKKEKKDGRSLGTFYPQTRNKSLYTTSTVQRKLKIAMNNLNWRSYNTITYPHRYN